MTAKTADFAPYKVGDHDTRPWGSYTVTAVSTNNAGEDICEKEIHVLPGQVLSLQSHEERREHWQVISGTLTVILDDQRHELPAGEDIRIPQGAIHCMANLSDTPCTVREIQEGICREDDIKRYIDAYGRGTETATGAIAQKSMALYQELLEQLGKNTA